MMGRRIVGCVSALAGAGALGGCVLADPPPTLPVVATFPPQIITQDVFPATEPVLPTLPSQFVVPVTVPPTTTGVLWQMFIDYTANPAPGAAVQSSSLTGPFEADAGDDIVQLFVPSLQPLTPGCHTVRIVVMLEDSAGGPDLTSADEGFVTWIYDPSGDPSSCAAYDAGSLNNGNLNNGSLGDAGEAG